MFVVVLYEKFEDTKCESETVDQRTDSTMAKRKVGQASNSEQNTTQKTKNGAIQTPLKNFVAPKG